jgi:glycosyltransferase involved in cell wall biosynthesis
MAVWTYGGIGTGHFSQGYPMLEKLLEHLSTNFEIVVYSQSAPHENFRSVFFSVRSAPNYIKLGILRWAYLVRYFIQDHAKVKFKLLFAFWGYPTGMLVACLQKLFGLPGVIYLLGSDSASVPSINYGILHKPLQKRLVKWAYQNISLLLTISQFQKDNLEMFGIKSTSHVIPWGADLSMYKFHEKTRRDILRVIHVGHLTPVKDQTTLLKAFALITKQLPGELRIFGVDCLNGEMQRLCKALNIERQVQFLDMIPYSEMPGQYQWADIMLHTSLSEGQSMALTEAAACGILLAGTQVGLLYDLGNEYGVTVKAGDYQNLAAKTIVTLENPVEWKAKVSRCRQWSVDHDIHWTVSGLTRLLLSL